MAHVQITGENLTIDGVDMAGKVLAEGFSVTWRAEPGRPLVHMTVMADVLEIDLPEAVIEALRFDRDDDYEVTVARNNEVLREMGDSLKRLGGQLDGDLTGKGVAVAGNRAATEIARAITKRAR